MPAYDASLFNPSAPLAKVTLCNQDNGNSKSDVPMLLDTGSDLTLIPQSSATQLGLAIDINQSYELMAFDGKLSTASVVKLDLIFLGRVFRGRYVTVNQEYGVIGRNILNYLTLLLDGPRSNWREERPSGAKPPPNR